MDLLGLFKWLYLVFLKADSDIKNCTETYEQHNAVSEMRLNIFTIKLILVFTLFCLCSRNWASYQKNGPICQDFGFL